MLDANGELVSRKTDTTAYAIDQVLETTVAEFCMELVRLDRQTASPSCDGGSNMVVDSGPSGDDVVAGAIPRSVVSASRPTTANNVTTTTTTTLATTTSSTWTCLQCRLKNPSTHENHSAQICRACSHPRKNNIDFFKTVYFQLGSDSLGWDHRRSSTQVVKQHNQDRVMALKDQLGPDQSKRQKKHHRQMPRHAVEMVAVTGNVRNELKTVSNNTVKKTEETPSTHAKARGRGGCRDGKCQA